ncbi:LruC domain-containing protein [Vibrio lamellibrachiae]|uniref:LruC domain-containing protein n=1 Tax=Vibrio lamellibrachiae TaxID=2910253 RepID=UPI003D1351B8
MRYITTAIRGMVFTLLPFWAYSAPFLAQDLSEFSQDLYHQFGYDVAINKDRAIVSVPGSSGSEGQVCLYLVNDESWSEEQCLSPTTSQGNSVTLFGRSIDISDQYVVIGAKRQGAVSTGVAYVFVNNNGTWHQEAEITPPNGGNNTMFGITVSVDGDYLVVGSPSQGANNNGVVYSYVKSESEWKFDRSFEPDSPNKSRHFGSSIHFSRSYLAIGDYEHGRNKEGSVTVYYQEDGIWTKQARLTGGAVTKSSEFGKVTAISKDYLLVGAPQENHPSLKNKKKCGAVYVYKRSLTQWQPLAKLVSDDLDRNDNFGSAVAIFDDHLVIGANGKDSRKGATYTFKFSHGVWEQVDKISLNNASNNDDFGSSVAISEDYLVLGAHNRSTGLKYSGSSYIYDLDKDTSPTSYELATLALSTQLIANTGDTVIEETDSDGDGLSNIDETAILKTDPNNPDTDGDGIDDRQEALLYLSDPLEPDTDSDGLSDLEEIITYNSDPTMADTDGDGYSDATEALILNTEPSLVDSDFDGLTDEEELTMTGTNPSLSDTDGDGLTDTQELYLFQTNEDNADSDSDGFSDGNEVNYYETDPLDSSSKPVSTTISSTFSPSSSEEGTMAFEDEWPITGDYDFNDAVVNYNIEETKVNGLVKMITFRVRPVARGAIYDNSLRLVINTPISNVESATSKSRGVTRSLMPVADINKTQFMLIEDLKSALPPPTGHKLSNTLTGSQKINGHQFVVTIEFKYPMDPEILGAPPYNTFIARELEHGEIIEVHFPGFPPTRHASRRKFGSIHDDSDPSEDRFYQTEENLPWAMQMPSSWHSPKEKVDLSNAYPDILNWAKSKGKQNKNWYKSKRKSQFIFDEVEDL